MCTCRHAKPMSTISTGARCSKSLNTGAEDRHAACPSGRTSGYLHLHSRAHPCSRYVPALACTRVPAHHLQLQICQKVRQMQNSFQNLQFLPFHGDDVEVKMDIQITQFIRLVQVPLSFLASAKQLKTPPLF